MPAENKPVLTDVTQVKVKLLVPEGPFILAESTWVISAFLVVKGLFSPYVHKSAAMNYRLPKGEGYLGTLGFLLTLANLKKTIRNHREDPRTPSLKKLINEWSRSEETTRFNFAKGIKVDF